jgi:benzil reductase ((S)-benzoin forming)
MDLYVITGTTKGLGQALAESVAAGAGNFLVTMSRGREGAGGARVDIAVDLADTSGVEAACDRMEKAIAGMAFSKAVLVNNAGIVSPVGPFDTVEAADLERNIAVNVTAPLLVMRRFLRATDSVPLRRVINISSGAGRRPIFGWGAYCASKAALDMASRVAAVEAQTRGRRVHVVSLAPGVIDTPMQGIVRNASAEAFVDVERFRKMKEEGVLRPPADVARDILALESAGRLDSVDAVADLRELAVSA